MARNKAHSFEFFLELVQQQQVRAVVDGIGWVLPSKLLIEVRHVNFSCHFGDVLRHVILTEKLLEIDVSEPRMLFNVQVADSSQSFLWFFLQKSRDEILSFFRNSHLRIVEEQRPVFDVIEHLFVVFVIERRVRVQQLVDQHSKAPPVYWE